MPDRIYDAINNLNPTSRKAYLKSGNEIISGLERLNIKSMTAEQKLTFYYFACECLAKILYGISSNKTMSELRNLKKFDVRWIKKAKRDFNLSITPEELDVLFNSNNKESARYIRNKIAHEFGRKSLQEMAERKAKYLPIFQKLLKEWEGVATLLNGDSTVLLQR